MHSTHGARRRSNNRRTAAAWNVKYLTVLFSHGVSKVFFHQRTWPLGLNHRSHSIHFDMLFDYGPRAHKLFVAVNAMAWRLQAAGPGRPVNEDGPLFAYRFDRPDDMVLVAWTDHAAVRLDPALQRLTQALTAYNMMGGRLAGRKCEDWEPPSA